MQRLYKYPFLLTEGPDPLKDEIIITNLISDKHLLFDMSIKGLSFCSFTGGRSSDFCLLYKDKGDYSNY